MKSDVVILGDELDGLVTALRLLQAGRSVRILARGMGSLHYAPGGLHVLGFCAEGAVTVPFEALAGLPSGHPYRTVGRDAVTAAMDWFLDIAGVHGLEFVCSGRNRLGVTAMGRSIPVLAPTCWQALGEMPSGSVAVLRFRGHRDFPAPLLLASLKRSNIAARLLDLDPPPGGRDSTSIARGFDRLPEPEHYFSQVAAQLDGTISLALFPAVLGLVEHPRIVRAAEAALGCPCREVPTLPPSVPGLRLSRALHGAIRDAGGLVHIGHSATGSRCEGRRCRAVHDAAGREYEAAVFVHAGGGVLMGGLEVLSDGSVREPVFDLPVWQTRPLEAQSQDAVEALHGTGIEVDTSLRPSQGDAALLENLLLTGRMLPHWNPVREASGEGVSIATGWAAGEMALRLLEG